MTKDDTYRRTFLGLLVIVVTVAFVAVLQHFLVTLMLAAVFAAILNPFYKRVVVLFRGRKRAASLVTLLLTIVIIVLPVIVLTGVLVGQALQISQSAVPWIQERISDPSELMRRVETLPGLDRLAPYRPQILTRLGEVVGTIGTFTVSKLSAVTKGTLAFALQLAILLYAMYFFLINGNTVIAQILTHIPLSKKEMNLIVNRFVSVTRAALLSTLVVGVIQGILGGLGFWVVGIPGAVFWGALMVIMSMIPGIGTTLVWLPAVAYLIFSNHVTAGLILLVYCALIVGSIDNILRPRLVGKDTKLHDLVVLLSTLGGIMLMGAVGFIIGPVIAALFITVWDIYAASMRGSAGMNTRVQVPTE